MSFGILRRLVPPIVIKIWLRKCEGWENLPKKGGFILAANHASYMDHFIIWCCIMPRIKGDIYFLAKKEHFDTFFQRHWHRYFKAIPIDRQAGGKEALMKAMEHLSKGHIIMIYPEGTRTLTGKINPAKTGVARLALWSKVPVVPIGLKNTFDILPKGKRFPRLKKCAEIVVGKPLNFERFYSRSNDPATWEKVTTEIMRKVAELADSRYRPGQK